MNLTVKEIASRFSLSFDGDGSLLIRGIATLTEADGHHLSFLASAKYIDTLQKTKAGAVLCALSLKEHIPSNSVTAFLYCDNPYAILADLAGEKEFVHNKVGIDSTAVIAATAIIGKGSYIGPFCHINENAHIGKNCIIFSQVFIGENVTIGDNCVLHPHVVVEHGCIIGNHVIIHAGTVIGADGYGYYQENGQHHKIPQIGIVEIGDNVEIGANTTIDRGSLGPTRIGSGTKIDNLVQIGHNVQVGQNCLIIAQAGIAGSAILKDNVIIAGQAGVLGHITLSENAVVGPKSGVAHDIPSDTTMSGYPALEHHHWRRNTVHIKNLDSLYKRVKALESELSLFKKSSSKVDVSVSEELS